LPISQARGGLVLKAHLKPEAAAIERLAGRACWPLPDRRSRAVLQDAAAAAELKCCMSGRLPITTHFHQARSKP